MQFLFLLGCLARAGDDDPSQLERRCNRGDLSACGDLATGLNREVVTLYRAGKYWDALPPAQRELAIREKALGPDHPNTAQSLNNLALLYHSMRA